MKLHQTCLLALVILLCAEWSLASTRSGGGAARVPTSSLKTLYFHDGAKTLARRGKSMPQLKCIGNSKHLCNTYGPDIVMCKSQGDGAWRCEADLHPDVRLGKIEVSCEGWENATDEYVMRGSCMLEYAILPAYVKEGKSISGHSSPALDSLLAMLFFFAFFGVVGYIIYSFFKSVGAGNSQPRGARDGRGGWGGFGPGGGGGGGDAPPPYYPHQKPGEASTSAWRPGFWSGLAAGGFATHAANRLSQGRQEPTAGRRRAFLDDDDDQSVFRQAGPSRSRGSTSTETRTSMNFGGTRNR